jgi:transposase-like protein
MRKGECPLCKYKLQAQNESPVTNFSTLSQLNYQKIKLFVGRGLKVWVVGETHISMHGRLCESPVHYII